MGMTTYCRDECFDCVQVGISRWLFYILQYPMKRFCRQLDCQDLILLRKYVARHKLYVHMSNFAKSE